MKDEDKQALTKYLVHVLRHDPEELGLSLSEKGQVKWDELMDGLDKYHEGDLDKSEVKQSLKDENRGRLEVSEKGVRALEGHTTGQVAYDYQEPPQKLFYAVSDHHIDQVLVDGIRSRGGYIKLHESHQDALNARSGLKNPTVVGIKAREGWNSGTVFYNHNNDWFAKDIPGIILEEE
jgi:putative RNA 2'-phosphotransferase